MVNMFGNLWLKSDEIHFGPILYAQYFRCGSKKNHESFSIIFVSSASLCFSGVDGVSRVILAESLLTVHKRVQNAQKSATLQHLRVIRKTSKDCSHNKSSNCWHSIVSEQDPEMRPSRTAFVHQFGAQFVKPQCARSWVEHVYLHSLHDSFMSWLQFVLD